MPLASRLWRPRALCLGACSLQTAVSTRACVLGQPATAARQPHRDCTGSIAQRCLYHSPCPKGCFLTHLPCHRAGSAWVASCLPPSVPNVSGPWKGMQSWRRSLYYLWRSVRWILWRGRGVRQCPHAVIFGCDRGHMNVAIWLGRPPSANVAVSCLAHLRQTGEHPTMTHPTLPDPNVGCPINNALCTP